MLDDLKPRRFEVVGYLPDLNRYMRSEDAFVRTAHYNSNGCSAEIISLASAFSSTPIPGPTPQACVSGLQISLEPIRPWLDRPMPVAHRDISSLIIEYPSDNEEEFTLERGQFSIHANTSVMHDYAQRNSIAEQSSWIQFVPRNPMTIKECAEFASYMDDLFVLLTNHECNLEQPTIWIGKDKNGKLHRARSARSAQKSSFFDIWISFPKIKSHFGSIVDRWLRMRKTLAAGFYLYLGTRRGVELYTEHRFINLIWGLESLHRAAYSITPNAGLEDKINRIKAIIGSSDLSSADRRWVAGMLARSREPPLGERIQELFAELPLNIPAHSLARFAQRCAKRRNDVSHLGGPPQGEDHDDFVLDLHRLASALDPLYHAAILKLIGVPNEAIVPIFGENQTGFQIEFFLRQAGLDFTRPSRC